LAVPLLPKPVFGKSDTEDISQAERNELKRTVPLLVAKYKGEL